MTDMAMARWWEPGRPEKSLSGVLVQDEERGWLLLLEGTFEESPEDEQSYSDGPRTIPLTIPSISPTLLGRTGEGRLITLFGCQVLGGSPTFLWSIGNLEISPQILAHDVHFESVNDFNLTSLSLRHSNLDQWTATSGFAVSLGESGYPLEVRYSKPEPISVELQEGAKISVAFSTSGPTLPARAEVRIVQRAWVMIESEEDRSYAESLRLITKFSDLVSLGIGQPVRPLEVSATCNAQINQDGPIHHTSLRIVQNREPIAPVLPDVEVPDMLFSLSDVRDRFSDFVKKWFTRYDEIKPLYDLYFGTMRSPKMYVEHRFLNMFQALESFDRRSRVHPAEKMRAHQDRLDRILTAVPQEDKKWLMNGLRHSHEPAASDRIRYLVEELKANWLLDNSTIALAADLRNFYTHYSPDLERRLPSVEERPLCMHNLAIRLQILCELVLLDLLGYSPDEARLQIEKTQRLERRLASDQAS